MSTSTLYRYHILITLILAFDLIWIFAMKRFYNNLVRNVQGVDIKLRMIPAVLSYACIITGILFFSIPLISQRLESEKNDALNIAKWCVIYGGGLGFVTYGVFNFTNMALFSKYDIMTAFIDTLWGVILCTLSTFTYFIFLSQ